MRLCLPNRLNRLRRCQKGTVAIEFAIVGGWLILMLGAIVETGIFLIIQFNLQNAAEIAGRNIRLNQVQSTTPLDQFKSEICAELVVRDCATKVFVDVRSDNTFTDLAAEIPFKANQPPKVGENETQNFEPGGPDQWGSLIITYDWDFSFPFMDTFFGNLPNGNRRLFGLSIFKNES